MQQPVLSMAIYVVLSHSTRDSLCIHYLSYYVCGRWHPLGSGKGILILHSLSFFMSILHPKLLSSLCRILFSSQSRIHTQFSRIPLPRQQSNPIAVNIFQTLHCILVKSQILEIVHPCSHPDLLFSVNIFCSLRTKFLHFYLRQDFFFTCGQWSHAKVQPFAKCNLHGSDFFKTLSVGLTLGFKLVIFCPSSQHSSILPAWQ